MIDRCCSVSHVLQGVDLKLGLDNLGFISQFSSPSLWSTLHNWTVIWLLSNTLPLLILSACCKLKHASNFFKIIYFYRFIIFYQVSDLAWPQIYLFSCYDALVKFKYHVCDLLIFTYSWSKLVSLMQNISDTWQYCQILIKLKYVPNSNNKSIVWWIVCEDDKKNLLIIIWYLHLQISQDHLGYTIESSSRY